MCCLRLITVTDTATQIFSYKNRENIQKYSQQRRPPASLRPWIRDSARTAILVHNRAVYCPGQHAQLTLLLNLLQSTLAGRTEKLTEKGQPRARPNRLNAQNDGLAIANPYSFVTNLFHYTSNMSCHSTREIIYERKNKTKIRYFSTTWERNKILP